MKLFRQFNCPALALAFTIGVVSFLLIATNNPVLAQAQDSNATDTLAQRSNDDSSANPKNIKWYGHYDQSNISNNTGVVCVLTREDFNRGNIVNVWQLIQGRVPGLLINQAGGEPGGPASVIVTHAEGPEQPKQPLVVLNGLPLNSDSPETLRNALNFIDPNDIQSVTLLKGGSANAIYGMQGHYGVLLIETYRPEKENGTTLYYSSTLSSSHQTGASVVADTQEFREIILNYQPEGYSPASLLGTHNTNWMDEIYRNSFSMNHYLRGHTNLLGVPLQASINYSDQQGLLLNDNMNRMGAQLDMRPTLFDDHLVIDLSFSANSINSNHAPQNAIADAMRFDPTQPVYDPGNIYGGYFSYVSDQGSPIPFSINPVARLIQTDATSNTSILLWSGRAHYRFHFLPALSAHIHRSSHTFDSERTTIIPDFAAWMYTRGGDNQVLTRNISNNITEAWLNYNYTIPNSKSAFDFMAGSKLQQFKNERTSFQSNLENNLIGAPYHFYEDSGMHTERHFNSFFTRAGYSYSNKYFANFQFRTDGTSELSQENRHSKYFALSAAWSVSNEGFWKDNNWISDLMFKGGYGQTGTSVFPNNSNFSNTIDPNLKLPVFETSNLGISYSLLKKGLKGTINYYHSQASETLALVSIPSGINSNSYSLVNMGKTQAESLELSFDAGIIDTQNWTWNIGIYTSWMKNKVVSLTGGYENMDGYQFGAISGAIGNNAFISTVGNPVAEFYLYPMVYDQNGNPLEDIYQDQNGDNIIDGRDRKHMGTPYPSSFGSVFTNIGWKNWTLSVMGRYQIGNKAYNNNASSQGNLESSYVHAGPVLRNIINSDAYHLFTSPQLLSNYYLEDGSFFRLDQIFLSYRLASLFNSNIDLSINATVQNAFLSTSYRGADPEVADGIDYASYSRPRQFTFGLEVQF